MTDAQFFHRRRWFLFSWRGAARDAAFLRVYVWLWAALWDDATVQMAEVRLRSLLWEPFTVWAEALALLCCLSLFFLTFLYLIKNSSTRRIFCYHATSQSRPKSAANEVISFRTLSNLLFGTVCVPGIKSEWRAVRQPPLKAPNCFGHSDNIH